jgi:HK97 family phage portal protein
MGVFDFFRKKKKKFTKQQIVIHEVNNSPSIAWTPLDYDKYAKESFMKNVIAFRCIDIVAKMAAMTKWDVYDTVGEERQIVTNSKENGYIKRPNPEESFNFLVYKIIAYIMINGNSFIRRLTTLTGTEKKVPNELHVLVPSKMKISRNKDGSIESYIYNNGEFKEIVDPITGDSNILHLKNFNPVDEVWGMPNVQPMSREVDTSNQSVEWNMRLIMNEARPGMLVVYRGDVTDTQIDQLEEQMKEFTSQRNTGETLIVSTSENGGIEVHPYSWSPKDIEFMEGGREMARRIANGFGVPPQMLGIPGDNTYSNYQEARLSLWEDTVMFYLNYIREEMNMWIYGVERRQEIDYDASRIPALIPRQNELWNRAQTASFITINEKRAMVGYPPIEGGDVVLIPANLLPLGIDIDMSDDSKSVVKLLKERGHEKDSILEIIGNVQPSVNES